MPANNFKLEEVVLWNEAIDEALGYFKKKLEFGIEL